MNDYFVKFGQLNDLLDVRVKEKYAYKISKSFNKFVITM